jgi:hypothetical protein
VEPTDISSSDVTELDSSAVHQFWLDQLMSGNGNGNGIGSGSGSLGPPSANANTNADANADTMIHNTISTTSGNVNINVTGNTSFPPSPFTNVFNVNTSEAGPSNLAWQHSLFAWPPDAYQTVSFQAYPQQYSEIHQSGHGSGPGSRSGSMSMNMSLNDMFDFGSVSPSVPEHQHPKTIRVVWSRPHGPTAFVSGT